MRRRSHCVGSLVSDSTLATQMVTRWMNGEDVLPHGWPDLIRAGDLREPPPTRCRWPEDTRVRRSTKVPMPWHAWHVVASPLPATWRRANTSAALRASQKRSHRNSIGCSKNNALVRRPSCRKRHKLQAVDGLARRRGGVDGYRGGGAALRRDGTSIGTGRHESRSNSRLLPGSQLVRV